MLLTLSLPEWIWESLKVVLTFESVDKILWCDYSNQTSLPILLNSAICFENFIKQNLGIFVEFCPWPHLSLRGVIVRSRYTRIRIFLKMEIFFIRFSLPSTRKRRFRGPKIFEKPASRLNVDAGTKTEVFEYSDAIHHILPALCVLRVRHTVVLSLVLAFSCARAETIQVNVTCI